MPFGYVPDRDRSVADERHRALADDTSAPSGGSPSRLPSLDSRWYARAVRRLLSNLWSIFGSLLALAGAVAAVAVIVATYTAVTDDTDVTALARAEACGDSGAYDCRWAEQDYRLVARTFEFVTPKQESVRVRCARPQIVFGAYACEMRERRLLKGASSMGLSPGRGSGKGLVKPRASASASPSSSASASASAPVPAADGGADQAK
jgi:hypothetical protein